MTNERENFLWVERYRPHKIEDCILPDKLKKVFKGFVRKGEVANMLLSGTPGTGKTTVARALCEELGCDYIVVNASKESGIDTLRTKISQFCSSVSFSGGTKVVILDEFDRATPAFQDAFRAFQEDFSQNARFILTCNFKGRIIDAIHSRCPPYDFVIEKADRPKIAAQFMSRVKTILETEGVEYNEKVVAQLVTKHFPDYRRILNELQRYAVDGKIDEGILANVGEVNIKELMTALKEKNFKNMRSWVVNNIDSDPAAIFRKIYDGMYEYVKPNCIPNLVLLLADYQYKSAFVADHELNLVACMTECMATIEFV